MTTDIGVIALEGCVGLSVFAPADLFNTANMIADTAGRAGARFSTHLLSNNGGPVRTSSGHEIGTQPLCEVASALDVVIVPGIGAKSFAELDDSLHNHRDVPGLLADLAEGGATIAAACTGTFLLGQSGLLNGRKATTTWWMAEKFRSQFPKVDLKADALLVDEENVVTSAAGASALDLSLHLIQRLAGPSLARLSAKYLVVDGGKKSQNLYSVPWHSKTRDPLLEKADSIIRATMGERLGVSDLAGRLHMGERTLLRRIRELTGMTPQQYIQAIRLDLIKPLLEAGDVSIAQIAADAGFSDENAFRRAFAQRMNCTPAEYRKRFRSV